MQVWGIITIITSNGNIEVINNERPNCNDDNEANDDIMIVAMKENISRMLDGVKLLIAIIFVVSSYEYMQNPWFKDS